MIFVKILSEFCSLLNGGGFVVQILVRLGLSVMHLLGFGREMKYSVCIFYLQNAQDSKLGTFDLISVLVLLTI